MLFPIVHTLIQQFVPTHLSQRDLYEVRERPSKTFNWFAYIGAQVTSEIPWNILCGTICYFCWYYPVGFYNNASLTDTVHERGAFMWFALVLFFIYTSTLGQMCLSFMSSGENAVHLAVLLLIMCLAFAGVLVSKDDMPGFWIFMYRFNPFTYLVSVMLSVGLVNSPVECSVKEYLRFPPPEGYTCGEYMTPYMSVAGGYLVDKNSTLECAFCIMSTKKCFLT